MKKTTTFFSKISALLIVLLTCGAITAETNYGIKIAGTELTSANAGAINNTNFPKLGLAEGGSITYDHSKKTFTLTGVTANVTSGNFMEITSSAEAFDYTINLIENNVITSHSEHFILLYRNLIVKGSGSLKGTSINNCGIYVYKSTLTIKNTTIEAIGRWGITANGGSSNEHLIIEKSNVTATGTSGSICDFQSITLTDCDITQPEGAAVAANGTKGYAVMLSGSVVKTEVKISPITGLSTLAAEGINVWGEKGVISIEIPGSASGHTAHIYSVSGMLARTLSLQGTEGQVAVPAGIYIVRIGTAIEKVVVR
ncbi:MAG TPA: hypothetical protein PK552_04675 [Paludibacteraceae bacterium]|nr:hypothetical protein [Paludibacteraceae bacterium]